jgi:TatD DNase family protein
MEVLLVDAHSHSKESVDGVIKVLSSDYFNGDTEIPESHFTIGLHPWWVQKRPMDWLEKIDELYQNDNCIALGEMGLDRSIETDFGLQKQILLAQLRLAKEVNSPYVVLHCVKAYSDILSCVKISRYQGKLFFHDFNGNEEILKQCLQYDSYFGFGVKLYKENTSAYKVFQSVPKDRVLLETDDQSEYTIEDFYEKSGMDKEQIYSNFKELTRL